MVRAGTHARRKSEFLQRVSITMAKGNSTPESWTVCATIGNLPPPDLVTSTVHNPRTLAATSDRDTHAPMAVTPSGGALVAL